MEILLPIHNNDELGYALLEALRQCKGAEDWSGECSDQVALPLKKGGYLNLGITDSDAAEHPYTLWGRTTTWTRDAQ